MNLFEFATRWILCFRKVQVPKEVGNMQQIDLEYEELMHDPYFTSMEVELDKNQTGACGEDYFCFLFRKGNFSVQFLGEKAPNVDCLVSFYANGIKYEFLVQVKSSNTIKYHKKTLSSGLTSDDYDKLLEYHLPTYLARVDINTNVIYLKGAFTKKTGTKKTVVYNLYPLSSADLPRSRKIMAKLATEVRRYWDKGMSTTYKQSFITNFK